MKTPSGKGYQFSEVCCNVKLIYLCGNHIEDITICLRLNLQLRPNARDASSNIIDRTLKSLACENTKYMSNTGIVYEYNEADKLNNLLLDMICLWLQDN